MLRMFLFNTNSIEVIPCVETLTTGARFQLHTSSKGYVPIGMNFSSAVTIQMDEQRRKHMVSLNGWPSKIFVLFLYCTYDYFDFYGLKSHILAR